MNNVNWQVVGHAVVGIIIATAQVIAMSYSSNAEIVNICHIVAVVAAQIGASLGVWTVSQSVAAKRMAAMTPCANCGKSPEPPPADKKPALAEEKKAA